MNHSQIAHLFFSTDRKNTNKNKNIFIYGNSIYSYGFHFALAIEEKHKGKKYLFVNTKSYSNSTAKHQKHIRHAINKNLYEKVFYFDFPNNWPNSGLYSYGFKSLFEEQTKEFKNYMNKHEKAISNSWHYLNACSIADKLRDLKNEFKEFTKGLKVPKITNAQEEKYEFLEQRQIELEATKEQRKRAKELKELEKQRENLSKWLKHEYNLPLYSMPVHLRLSKDGEHIETTKGAKVGLKPALLAHKAIINGKSIGLKIDGFTILETTLDYIKIGCHVIGWNQINDFLESNNLA